MESSSSDQIKRGDQHQSNDVSSEGFLSEIADFPLSRPTLLGRIGGWCFFLIGVGLAYFITKNMPNLPEIVFYPILLVVLFLELVIKQSLWNTKLRLDTRVLVFGPVWARKSCPFADIKAIQLLEVLRIRQKNSRQEPRRYEINVVLSPSNRILLGTNKNKEKARNVAHSWGEIVKAPIEEQLFLEKD
jgi:hypothetical protein